MIIDDAVNLIAQAHNELLHIAVKGLDVESMVKVKAMLRQAIEGLQQQQKPDISPSEVK